MNIIELISTIIGIIIEFIQNAFGLRNRCDSKRQLTGQLVVITGANTGIGKETALDLAKRGAKIIIGCRDESRAESAIKDIKKIYPKADIRSAKLDLSSLVSVREFAQRLAHEETKLDILINNAGVGMIPDMRTNEDGYELAFATNHLGHYLLTLLLLPLLREAPRARVVNVSSLVHKFGKIYFENIHLRNGAYEMNRAYAQSKLANILFTRELARRLGRESTVTVYALHPGIIATEFLRYDDSPIRRMINKLMIRFIGLTPDLGAQTTLYCAVDESLDNQTGHYYDNCRRIDSLLSHVTDNKSAEKLWDLSSDLVKLDPQYNIPSK
ncbi:retinol dehydrogenase 12-like [Oppia nitens]|uniref:retinol dehydrogenase 12-like n=1 Tax=Oppia nitens TaxID=1686743 RepID=UPI0023DB35B7|nr:retinol dehydrogenase 12-like [Oppia nitens]